MACGAVAGRWNWSVWSRRWPRSFETSPPARQTTLCVSERVNVPSAIGFLRPAIVFPAWLLPQLSADEIAVILLHEHAHLRRWDQWTNLAQKFARALFFFHPAVWWIENHLTLEREMACDDIVLAQSQSPKAYASFLVSFAEKLQHAPGLELAQALVSRMHQMSMRVTQILDGKRSRRTGLWAPVLAVNAVLLRWCLARLPMCRSWWRSALSRAEQSIRRAVEAASKAQLTDRDRNRMRLAPALQPRVIPAAYHPRTAVLPLRLKAASHAALNYPTQANRRLEWATTTSAKPAVIRAKAERTRPPARRHSWLWKPRNMTRPETAFGRCASGRSKEGKSSWKQRSPKSSESSVFLPSSTNELVSTRRNEQHEKLDPKSSAAFTRRTLIGLAAVAMVVIVCSL